jgi:UDP-N-acetylglucosamine 2-epimerase (non-hydrolysing)
VSLISRNIPVVFPIHPRTKKMIDKFELNHLLKNVIIADPLGYFDLMGLVMNSKLVITDSGGLQKESYYCGKQAIVIMPDTCWIELVTSNYNILVNPDSIYNSYITFQYHKSITEFYGDGTTSKKIIDIIVKDYNEK